MSSLEDRLRPGSTQNPLLRDLLGVGLLIALGAILLPVWGIGPDALRGIWGEQDQRDLFSEAMTGVSDQMASVYLLMSLGFLLALRCGAIDLSVWVVAGLGGLVTAGMINVGVWPVLAMAGGAAAGGVAGAINALLVVRLRVPSVFATVGVALALMWSLQLFVHGRSVVVGDDTFASWRLVTTVSVESEGQGGSDLPETQPTQTTPVVTETVSMPFSVTRKLLVAAIYALMMLVLVQGQLIRRRFGRLNQRRLLFAVLCASGVLAAAGGSVWVLDHAAAPVPTRLIGDLRVVSAALLAGGAFFCGRGRAPLAAVWLLAGFLISSIWRLEVWTYTASGYSVQIIVLILMTLIVHAAFAGAITGPRRAKGDSIAWVVLTGGGMLVFAAAAAAGARPGVRGLLHICGAGVWAVGAAGVLLSRAVIASRSEAR